MISQHGDNLVFLLSLPRAGSTLLGMMLGSHPAVHCPPEPWIQLPLAALVAPKTGSGLLYDDYTATIATAVFLENTASRKEARAPLSEAMQEFLAHLSGGPRGARFAQAVYNLSLSAAGKTIFVDKTPRYYHALDFLAASYPEAKMIILRRDPLDVARSYRTTWNVSVDEMVGKVTTAHTVDFAKGLFELERFGAANGSTVLNIAYEDLVRDPKRTLEQVCDYLAIDFSEQMLAFYDNADLMQAQRQSPVGDRKVLRAGRKTDASSVGKWVAEFTHDELFRLVGFLGTDIFLKLGYDKTLEKLRSLGIELPSEKDAEDRRAEVLAGDARGADAWPLLSKWSFFIAGIKADPPARDTLLKLLYRQAGAEALTAEREGDASMDLAFRLLQAEHHLAERLGAIDDLTNALKKADQVRTAHLGAIDDLTNALKKADQERTAHLNAIDELVRKLRDSVARNAALLQVMHRLPVRIALRLFRIQDPEALQEQDARGVSGVPGGDRE